MCQWSDPAAWELLRNGATCPICVRGKPRDIIAELETAYLTTGDDSGIKGYCCLVCKRHAVELHNLTADEGAALMRDLQRVSSAIMRITHAIKLNYEIHGNTIPHLHVHFFPRYAGDPFEGGPIEPRKVKGKQVYAPGEFEQFVSALRHAVGHGHPPAGDIG